MKNNINLNDLCALQAIKIDTTYNAVVKDWKQICDE